MATYDHNVAVENSIDNKLEQVNKLKEDYSRLLKIKRKNYELTNATFVDEIEDSLSDDRNWLYETEIEIRSKIDTAWQLVNEKREESERLKSAQLKSQVQRMEKVKVFGEKVSVRCPKFRDSLRVYSEDYLTEQIEEIRNEKRDIENKIAGVDRQIKDFVSKHNIDEINAIANTGKDAAITELTEFKQIWMNSNFNNISMRKLTEYSIKELEGKVELNKRRLARLNN